MEALGGQQVTVELTPFATAAPMLYQDAFLAERYSATRGFLNRGQVRACWALERACKLAFMPSIRRSLSGGLQQGCFPCS